MKTGISQLTRTKNKLGVWKASIKSRKVSSTHMN